MGLLDERSLSDMESDVGRADVESKSSSPIMKWTLQPPAAFNGSRSIFCGTAFFLLPSFIQARLSHDSRARASSVRPGPTAYLDGMRGLAALFVFFCHFSYTCFVIAQGWGYDGNYHFLTLPIIRLFYQGPPMVCVFFVVSGYALSLKPLKLMRSRNFDAFATAMSSFTFRRLFRLFLPIAASTFLIVVLVRLGLYEWTRGFASDDRYLRNVQELHYGRMGTTAQQLSDWIGALFNMIHVWDWGLFGGSTWIDLHLWTIAVEFRCSMMLFLTLIGTARLKTAVRFAVVAALIVFCYRHSRWDMILFYAGMVLAEVDIIRGAHTTNPTTTTTPLLPFRTSSPSSSTSAPHTRSPSLPAPPTTKTTTTTPSSARWLALSVLGLYLMSQPDEGGAETPGWALLTRLIPPFWSQNEGRYRHWQSVGAVLFVLAVGRCPGWQRLFNCGVVQYLGQISYSMYLMHGPVLHTVGYAVERGVWDVMGTEGGRYAGGFAVAAVVVVPVVIWAADVFWRAVDAPVVRFAKWLEGRCSISE
jgi:peptidoglycan/LPS O-acetylase OafA/YrhL